MSHKSNFELMAVYNQWMNESIYKAASKLSSDELAKDRNAFFGSIIGTLNHILVGDTVWLKRFASHESNFASLEYVRQQDNPVALNTFLLSGFDDLRLAREKMDKVILKFAQELTEEAISKPLSYKSTEGQPFVKIFAHLLQHFFNHQTHHRGQVSTLLSQAGIEVGVTDLVAKIPNA